MSEPEAEELAVFHAASLPGHPANPNRHMTERPDCDAGDKCCVLDWPRSPSGVPFMPMSGRYVVRSADGDQVREDGFLVEDGDGHPVWLASPPD